MGDGGPGFIGTGNYHSITGDKYEAVSTDNGYNKYMMLKIRNVSPKDFGSYKCVAQNSLGGTDGDIKLDGETFSDSNKCASRVYVSPIRHGEVKFSLRRFPTVLRAQND